MSVLVPATGESRELGVPSCSRAGQCVGVSGSLVNRVHQLNRVVGGAVHPWASPGAAERIQDWVLGGKRCRHGEQVVWGARVPRVMKPAAHMTCIALRRERRPAVSRVRQASSEQVPSRGTRPAP